MIMVTLDDVTAIRAVDRSNVYGSIVKLADQASQAWEEISQLSFPRSYQNAAAIVVSGMGGSSIGAHLVQSVFRSSLPLPMVLSNDYKLPGFVSSKILVVLSSYSGNTEETLASAEEAWMRKALITGITTGGKLAEFLRVHRLPGYVFEAKHNPGGQPRLAVGYSVMAQVALFSKLGYLRVSKQEVAAVVSLLKKGEGLYGVSVPAENNLAKQLAQTIQGKIPVLVSAGHLEGAVHVLANQLNESAKSYSDLRVIPELNHHLMEGLASPMFLREGMVFVFLRSSLYHPRVAARFPLTAEVVKRNGVETFEVLVREETPLLQAFEFVLLGSYTNFYLAMLYGVDPAPIPWVDYFKARLS